MRLSSLLCSALLFAASQVDLAQAQEPYPSQLITIVIGFPPGGATDTVARIVADDLTARLGQKVIVENQPGGEAMIAAQQVLDAAPDGYTLYAGWNSKIVGINAEIGADGQPQPNPIDDLAPVGLVAKTIYALTVHPSLPVGTVTELADYVKAHPGELSYGSAGEIGPQRLAMELLKLQLGLDIQNIPYGGSAGMMPDLLSGRVPVAFVNVSQSDQITSGALHALAVAATERSSRLPDVPTMEEAGVAGFGEVSQYIALFAPPETPPEIIDRLHAALAEMLAGGDARDRLVQLGLVPADVDSTPQDVTAELKLDVDNWNKVLAAAQAAGRTLN